MIKFFVILFFAYLLFFIYQKLNFYNHNIDGFILGDWLVNYQDGGFKRRGLSGSFFFLIQDISGLRLQFIVFWTQIVLYLIFFIAIVRILYKKTISFLFITIIISPLTFLFYFNDPTIVGRKELLLLNIFIYYIFLLSNKKLTKKKEYLIYSLIFIATFFHEIIIFYIPYFVLASYLFNKKLELKKYILIISSSLIPAIIIFLFGAKTNEGSSIQILADRGIDLAGKRSIFDFSNDIFFHLEIYKNNPLTFSLYGAAFVFGLLHLN